MSQYDLEKFPIYMDAFNMLCGKLLGEGIHRQVYECKLRPDLVVKVEYQTDYREFANIREQRFWDDNQHAKAISQWLAPCEYLSPDGRILLQKRVRPIDPVVLKNDLLPKLLPAFLTDRKIQNFGWIESRIVCCDYATTIENPSLRMTKAEWWS